MNAMSMSDERTATGYQKKISKIKIEKLLDAFKKEKKGRRNSLKQRTEFSFLTKCLAVSFISNAI